MSTKKPYLVSLFVVGLVAMFVVGCDQHDATVNSEPVVFNDGTEIHDPSFDSLDPIDVVGISADSLNALARAQYLQDMQNGLVATKTTGWIFNINMPSSFSQIDPAWKYHSLGYNWDGRSTIGRYGCYLCSMAMVLVQLGCRGLTPPVLNDWSLHSQAHYAFSTVDNGDKIWLAHAVKYPATSRYYQPSISYDQIYPALRNGWPVIIKIPYGTGYHYMVIYAFDGYRYWVLDPLQPPAQNAIPLYGNVIQSILVGHSF